MKLNIIRTIAGLALPVPCAFVQGFSVGSCSYNDLCKDVLKDIMKDFLNNDYGINFFDGFNFSCPFDLEPLSIEDELEINIPDFSGTPANFLLTGDFDVTATFNDIYNRHVACFRFKFTLAKA